MGRKKSNYVCDKCGQIGFRAKNPDRVIHYEHATRRRRACYVKKLITADHETAEDPPEKYWGKSELYHKLGSMANHFRRIAEDLENIQRLVYKFKPDETISTQCVKDLEIFEKSFLNPVETLLVPYHDRRWSATWPDWFKIQMDSFKHGPRAAGMINAKLTGQYFWRKKGRKTFVETPVEREMTGLQVKKKEQQTLEFANEILCSHPLEKALANWASNTNIIIEEDLTKLKFL